MVQPIRTSFRSILVVLVCLLWCPALSFGQLLYGGVWSSESPSTVLPDPFTSVSALTAVQDWRNEERWIIGTRDGLIMWNRASNNVTTILKEMYQWPVCLVQDDSNAQFYVCYSGRIMQITIDTNSGNAAVEQVVEAGEDQSIFSGVAYGGRLYIALSDFDAERHLLWLIDPRTGVHDAHGWDEVTKSCEATTPSLSLTVATGEILLACLNGIWSLNATQPTQAPIDIPIGYLALTQPIQAIRHVPSGYIYFASAMGSVWYQDGTTAHRFLGVDSCGRAIVSIDTLNRVFISCASAGILMLDDNDSLTRLTTGSGSCQGRAVILSDRSRPDRFYFGCMQGFSSASGRTISTVVDLRQCAGMRSLSVDADGRAYIVCLGDGRVMSVTGLVLKDIDVSDRCPQPEFARIAPNTGVIWLQCLDDESGESYLVSYDGSNLLLIEDKPLGELISIYVSNDDLFVVIYDEQPILYHYTHEMGFQIVQILSSQSTLSLYGMNQCLYVTDYYQATIVEFRRDPVTGSYNFNRDLINRNTCTPYELTGDPVANELFVACGSTVVIIDLTNRTETRLIDLTAASTDTGLSVAISYNPVNRLLAVSIDSNIILLHRDTLIYYTAEIEKCASTPELEWNLVSGALLTVCGSSRLLSVTSSFRCLPGSEWFASGCQSCPPGYSTGRVDQRERILPRCLGCRPGTIAPLIGTMECDACPRGRYQDMEQQSQQFCNLCQNGEFQNDTGATQCQPCPPGEYSPDVGLYECSKCPPGTFSALQQSSACTACDRGSASNVTGRSTPCDDCPQATEQIQSGQTECIPCKIGSYTPAGGQCVTCVLGTYSPGIGSPCLSCVMDGQNGLDCSGGFAHVKPGWWPYQRQYGGQDEDQQGQLIYYTTQCPNQDQCTGSILDPTSEIQFCQSPRLNSPDNWLCAECIDGYIPWGGKCVSCTGANVGLIFLFIILGCLLVLFLLRSSTSSAGHITILLFFIQTSALEIETIVEWLEWLQFVNLSTNSTQGCLARLTPIEQQLLTMLTPIILMGILILYAIIHMLMGRCYDSGVTTSRVSCLHRVLVAYPFSIDHYIGAMIGILLFCYTSVAVSIVELLHCSTIAPDVRVLFSLPTVHCDSSEYRNFLPFVIVWLCFYILGFPIGMLIFLRYRRVHLRRNEIDEVAMNDESNDKSDAASASVSSTVAATGLTGVTVTHAPASVPSSKLSPFEIRWGGVYRGFTHRAWFWQPMLLLRRFAFALTSVLLIKEPTSKFVLFAFLNFVSLLAHSWTRPFASDLLNHVDSCSYILLVCISLVLAGSTTPYSMLSQVTLFLLIVPPAAAMILWTGQQQWKRLRHGLERAANGNKQDKRNQATIDQRNESNPTNPYQPESDLSGVELQSVELGSTASNSSSLTTPVIDRDNAIASDDATIASEEL